jgi:hypothetical protein
MLKRLLLTSLLGLALFVPLAGATGTPSPVGDLVKAYLGSVRFLDVAGAQSAGYAKLADAAGITCIAQPGEGAMGIHYVNGTFVGDTMLDAGKPEAAVYEPQANGRLRLVALEYIVFQDKWDAAHSSPPKLFGQTFMLTPAPNRFGIPAFYSLHAWIWKANPAGTFAMWNPNVHCPKTSATSAEHHHH